MAQSVFQGSFSGGELAPSLRARQDLNKYGVGCRLLENFVIQPHGGAYVRAGMEYVAKLPGTARLIRFQFNVVQSYALVFTNTKMYVSMNGGIVATDDGTGDPVVLVGIDINNPPSGYTLTVVTTPYLEAELRGIYYAQSADTLYLCHPNHAVRTLTRTDHDAWTLTTVTFGSTQVAPLIPTVVWTDSNGSGDRTYIPATITQRYVVTAVSADGEESVASPEGSETAAYSKEEWVSGDYITITWASVTGANEYNVYKEENGVFGYIGTTTDLTFRDDNYDPELVYTPQVDNNPFASRNPYAVTFEAQRLWFGGSDDAPQTIWGSRVAGFTNFNKSRPTQDDDSVEATLASTEVNAIRWLIPFDGLMVGTQGSEWKIESADGPQAAITPSSAKGRKKSTWGSRENLIPVEVGDSILQAQLQGSKVRDLSFSFEQDTFVSSDLSILASHLFQGRKVVEWSFQREPDGVLWCIMDDGALIGMTYHKEHQIWAWHRHATEGDVISTATVKGDLQDDTHFVVERTVGAAQVFYLERMADKWDGSDIEQVKQVDAFVTYDGVATKTISGLDHLEGLEVTGLADGSPIAPQDVLSGEITLPYAVSVAHVGLAYTGKLAPMGVNTGLDSVGRMKSFGKVVMMFEKTVGGKAGPKENTVDPMKFTPALYGNPIDPVDVLVANFDPPTDHDQDGSFYIIQDQPLPMTVLGLMPDIEVGDK